MRDESVYSESSVATGEGALGYLAADLRDVVQLPHSLPGALLIRNRSGRFCAGGVDRAGFIAAPLVSLAILAASLAKKKEDAVERGSIGAKVDL